MRSRSTRPARVRCSGRRGGRRSSFTFLGGVGQRFEDGPEAPAIAGKVDPRGGAEHAELFRGEELPAADEDPAGTVDHSRLAGGENCRRHLVAESLQIGRGPGVQDDEVHHHPAPAPVLVRGEELPQGGSPSSESMVARRIGQSPERPTAQSMGWEPWLARSSASGARSRGSEKKSAPASCWKTPASTDEVFSSRSSICAAVQARSSARCAERGLR